MSTLARLSLARIAQRLPDFPGATLPDKLAAGRAEAERVLRKYVPDFAYDVPSAEQVTRTVDAWSQRNEQSLSEAMTKTDGDLPGALHLAMGSASQVQQFLIASFTLAAAGLGPWMSGDIARYVSEGEHAEGWAMLDAEGRLQTFGIIVAMDRDGDLAPIFQPEATAGVGALPAAAWVAIVIVTAIFAAAVVLTIHLNQRTTLNNRLMREICLKEQERGNQQAIIECIKATKGLQVSMLEETGSKLMTVALLIGAGYLAIKLLPMLSRTKKARA